jgi:hypothetical protein
MKKLYIVLSMIFSAQLSSAQNVIQFEECNSVYIKNQVDSLKQIFAKKGFTVLKETYINMESEYEMPIIFRLQQGWWYEFVFIGEPTSRLYEVRMFDWNEREVVYIKHLWGDVDGNVISFPYIPQFSEFHMLKPVQVNKKQKKNLCGYVMVLKKIKGGPIQKANTR